MKCYTCHLVLSTEWRKSTFAGSGVPVQQNVIAPCRHCNTLISLVCAPPVRLLCEHNSISSPAATSCQMGTGLIKMRMSPVHRRSLALPNLVCAFFSFLFFQIRSHPVTHTQTKAHYECSQCGKKKKNKSSYFNLPLNSPYPISLPRLLLSLLSSPPCVDSHRIY